MQNIINVRGLSHIYPDKTEVSFGRQQLTVRPGQIVAVLAANGAGKTTLLQHITGMLQPQQGEVRVFGLDPFQQFEQVRQRLALVFQNPAEQIIGPTVAEDIAFGLASQGLSPQQLEQRVAQVLAQMGIAHLADKVPHYLSGGEVKKVALAGALAVQPELLVLDEPFAELDIKAVGELVELLQRVSREQATTILFTSHQLQPVALLADTVYILHRGKVAAQGTPLEVFQAGEVLERCGLQAPDTLRLVAALQKAGVNIRADFDVDRVAAQILSVLGIEK